MHPGESRPCIHPQAKGSTETVLLSPIFFSVQHGLRVFQDKLHLSSRPRCRWMCVETTDMAERGPVPFKLVSRSRTAPNRRRLQ